ncbi:hypothetical protein [Wenjunlia tyrosinilytica]|nr:hypothetical protein [Wenjunlia tyrosinilytica]
MKTTMMFRSIANPRRTTLAHLEDAETLQPSAVAGAEGEDEASPTPVNTANPRRTTLMEAPIA